MNVSFFDTPCMISYNICIQLRFYTFLYSLSPTVVCRLTDGRQLLFFPFHFSMGDNLLYRHTFHKLFGNLSDIFSIVYFQYTDCNFSAIHQSNLVLCLLLNMTFVAAFLYYKNNYYDAKTSVIVPHLIEA